MPKQRVHHQLHVEIAADAVRGLAQRLGRDVDAPRADQADQPLAHALAVEQQQDGEDHHRERGAHRLDERPDHSASAANALGGVSVTGIGAARRVGLVLQFLDRLGGLAEGAFLLARAPRGSSR